MTWIKRIVCLFRGHKYSPKIVCALSYCTMVIDTCDRCGEGTSDLNLAKTVAHAKDSGK